MEEELIKEVKIKLRSLVVSSPTQMDSRLLMRDYSNLLGTRIPLARMGYRDFVTFLREQCSDSFLLSGPPSNPILTVIVPESSKHIDNFVQRSKLPSTAKIKTKRRSIQESKVNPKQENLIYNSFVKHNPGVVEDTKKTEVKAPDVIPNNTRQNKENVGHRKNTEFCSHDVNDKEDVGHHRSTIVTSNDVKNFLKKRIPLYNSSYELDEAIPEKEGADSVFQEDYSRRCTSNGKGSKSRQFEEFKSEIMELISAAPEGVWCTDLIRLYRERYNRELNFTRFGYTSIISVAYALEEHVHITRPVDTGDWLLMDRSRAAAAPAPGRPRAALAPRSLAARAAPADDADDALPGVQFDPDVFPEDCVGFMESIPSQSLAECRPGAMLEVMVGEVYSPSHFWLIRIGDHYNQAMEEIMDEMTLYYNGEGRDRVLARGAVRVGHFCSTLYESDWHRSVIVKIIDSDTVKVRHVDYGTVETVPVRGLRALRRQWAALPAQAIRARLAGLRPAARGRRWPHAAATRFLRLVHNARLYANVVAVDTEHDVLETLLIDTRGADDLCLSAELIRCGHADPRADSMLRTKECYLYPRFEALENGDTPNMAEIHAYLRDGIALDYVDSYRRHVPACLPSPSSPSPEEPEPGPGTAHEPDTSATDTHELGASPPARSPEPAQLATRIPLVWPGARSGTPRATRDNSPCVPSPAPTHRLPAATAEHIPVQPQNLRSPDLTFDPSVNLAPTMPPVGQSFPPTHRLPAATAEHIPVQPQNLRSPDLTFDPSVNLAPAMPPVAQSFPPLIGYLPQPAPAPAPWAGGVVLSRAECDTYCHLSHVSPQAAHWYMVGTLARAMGAPPTLGPGPAIGPLPVIGPLRAIGPLPAIGPGPAMGPIRAPPGFGA